MSANTSPRFTKQANVSSVAISAALTDSSGAGNLTTPTIFKAFTAGADGSFVEFLRVMAVATVAATATTATVLRIYRSTVGSGATTAADTHLIGEVALPSVSADATTTAINAVDFPLNINLASGEFIHVSTHHAPAANTGQRVTVFGADF